MIREIKKGYKRRMFVSLCIITFIVSFAGSIAFKATYKSPKMAKYSVKWSDEVGTIKNDLAYGDGEANKFDLYLPADDSKETYGLVVYLHAGGFTTGDKSDDSEMLKWLCSKGYIACGINYTLRTDEHPEANVYTQSTEIKEAMPYVVKAAEDFGYHIDEMAISGGSAGGCLALLYAYRDCDTSPVPVKMVFEAVGPSCFYPEDWKSYGGDQNLEATAGLFSVMSGEDVTPEMFGTKEYDEVMKNVSALLWVNENTVPSVLAYGMYDKIQPYEGSVRLNEALDRNNVPHEYFVMEHSGHGLQNDSKTYLKYMEAIEQYLQIYLPVK